MSVEKGQTLSASGGLSMWGMHDNIFPHMILRAGLKGRGLTSRIFMNSIIKNVYYRQDSHTSM